MTGKFTDVDPRKCAHYARFLKHLTRIEANAVYWTLFVVVIMLMCISSLEHHKSIALADADKHLPTTITSSSEHKLKVRRLRIRYLCVVSLCFLVSLTCIILECFAAFNIEYCDGEDLMSIYWGSWIALQVGGVVAMLGIIVHFWIVLRRVETPSWGVALGTPVLVFAAIGFLVRAMWVTCVGRRKLDAVEMDGVEAKDDEEKNIGSSRRSDDDQQLLTAPSDIRRNS